LAPAILIFAGFLYKSGRLHDGNLKMVGQKFPDLSGLENLKTIGGDLQFKFIISLASMSGLDNLMSIGGKIMIEDNLVFPNLYVRRYQLQSLHRGHTTPVKSTAGNRSGTAK